MMPTRALLLVALLFAACDFRQTPASVDGGELPVSLAPTQYGASPAKGSTVIGYAWDIEAYWVRFALCGQSCPLPPLAMPGMPLFDPTLASGVPVSLFDPVEAKPAFHAADPTAADGTWTVSDVTSRPAPPFFAVTGPGTAPPPDVDNPVPGGDYVPTFSMRPIATGQSFQCLGVSSPVVSDTGVLRAVAGFLTESGTATTVADLLDPSKTGGVAVFWRFMPGGSSLRVPAFGTGMTASAGTTYQIAWAPPGLLPPSAGQSERGFYVDDGAPVSAIGVSVTVLPPGPPAPVQFAMTDPVVDAAQGRPWAFPPLPPAVVAPGVVSFGELQAALPTAGAPPPWICVPH